MTRLTPSRAEHRAEVSRTTATHLSAETAMADNSDSDESTAMLLRRVQNVETVSSDIALRLAEMLFIRHYSRGSRAVSRSRAVMGWAKLQCAGQPPFRP